MATEVRLEKCWLLGKPKKFETLNGTFYREVAVGVLEPISIKLMLHITNGQKFTARQYSTFSLMQIKIILSHMNT